ncbi:MAG: hypothetical protein IKI04_02850, partial [Bacilli bacterium]|nr:hypothetical protein [Bacilli bacterium]
ENFKYALTTSQNSCTTNVISEGNFYGIESGDTIPLLNEATRGSTYYLYIWLDSAETNNETQYNWVDISLGGECTNNGPNYTYAIDLLGGSDNNRYQTPAAAMTALKTAGGGSVEHPIFLRYRTVPVWLDDYHNAYYTEDECLQSTHNDGCPESTHIVETYVGFVVSPELAADNQGMTAGTYYLRDGYDNNADDPSHAPSLYYEDNEEIMTTAFGSNNCQYLDNGNYYYCAILNDLSVSISSLGGEINVSDTKGANCGTNLGSAHCSVSAP